MVKIIFIEIMSKQFVTCLNKQNKFEWIQTVL